VASAGFALWPLARTAAAAPRFAERASLDPKLAKALEQSPYVYVSPLRKDGSESSCHGEVWYAWLDGAVVLTSASSSWKARAVARGLTGARVWVGDHGRWKQLGLRNEAFREAPRFDARAEVVKDAALVERMLAEYDRKYPDEIGKWRERMRTGNADGSRVLLRYVPEPAART
jgi:hypothetical protein